MFLQLNFFFKKMKDIKLFYGLLLLSILFISIKSVDIYYIADGLTNSTATIVYLEDIQEDFVYLGFDFVFHAEIDPHSKNYATFNINGNIDSIKYALTEKEPYTIDNVDDIKEWKDTNGGSISRTDEKMKTLLFKVFIKDKSGEIFAENIPSSSPGGYEESNDQTDLTAHTDKIERSDKTEPTAPVKTDTIEQSDKPVPPPPLKTDKIDENDSTNSDSNSEKSIIDKIKDIIQNILNFIKKLFGLI